MTYFNPKIFNKNNLKEKDRKELEYYDSLAKNCIDATLEDIKLEHLYNKILDKIYVEVAQEIRDSFLEHWGYTMQAQIVGILDSDDYSDEDIKEYEKYDTFLYDGEEENE